MKISKVNGKNYYQAYVKKPDGKYKKIYGKTKKEVREKAESLAFDIKNGKFVESNKITVSEWCQEWLDNYLISVSDNTAHTYKTIVKTKILPYFKDQQLQKVSHHQIQVFMNSFNGKLSPKYIHNIHLVTHRLFKDALNNGFITNNPADNIILPKIVPKEMNVLDQNEIKNFLEVAYETEPYYADCFDFMLNTGLRVGELMGLPIDAYDPKYKTLTIRQQYTRRSRKFSLPKHGKIRIIVLSDRAIKIIENRIEKQKPFEKLNKYGLVFLNKDYGVLNDNTLRDSLNRICEKIDKKDFRIHDLRHTYTTLCLASGVDIKTLSQNLGHNSPVFTLNKYSHSTSNMQKDSANKVDMFFDSLDTF